MNLTKAQVFLLNEKHGWFAYGDAQSDVSVAFANDAIKMYNALRDDAPALLEALKVIVAKFDHDATFHRVYTCREKVDPHEIRQARALIARHRGGI